MALSEYKKNKNELLRKKSDEEQFDEIDLTLEEIQILKVKVLEEQISIPCLVDLVLLEKAGRDIKKENKKELLLRGYIDRSLKITEAGKTFVESEEVKDRLGKLLNE